MSASPDAMMRLHHTRLPQELFVVCQLDDKGHLHTTEAAVTDLSCKLLRSEYTCLECVLQPLGEVERNEVAKVQSLGRRPLDRAVEYQRQGGSETAPASKAHPSCVQVKAARVFLVRVEQQLQVPAQVMCLVVSHGVGCRATPTLDTRTCARRTCHAAATRAPWCRSRARSCRRQTALRSELSVESNHDESAPSHQLSVNSLTSECGEQLVVVNAALTALHVPRRDYINLCSFLRRRHCCLCELLRGCICVSHSTRLAGRCEILAVRF